MGMNKKNLTWQPIEHKGQAAPDKLENSADTEDKDSPEYEIR